MPPKENRVLLNLSIKTGLPETSRSHASPASLVPTYSLPMVNSTPAASTTPMVKVTPAHG